MPVPSNRQMPSDERVSAANASGRVSGLARNPVVVGHSLGGLLAQIVAGRGQSAVTVAVDPAPFRGVLPVPLDALRKEVAQTALDFVRRFS